jgi:isopentenyl-diphosphate delta-isomerase
MVDADESVLLVDARDRAMGTHAKLDAHRQGLRHRAFSVFLADSDGRLLLQGRSPAKYHSGGLWSNACCGHPRAGETNLAAARRRLGEEMGLEADLRHAGRLSYRAALSHGWYENEIVHLFIGRSDAAPQPDPNEVSRWRHVEPQRLASECASSPEAFTQWFRIYMERVPDIALLRSAQALH